MPTLKELQETRGKLAAGIRSKAEEFNANGKQWKSEEDRVAWKKINDDYNANMAELEAAQKREAEAVEIENRRAELDEHDSRSRDAGRVIPGNEDTNNTRPIGGREVDEETRCLAMAGFLFGGESRECTDRHRAAMSKIGINPQWKTLDVGLSNTRSVQRWQRDCRNSAVSAFLNRHTGEVEQRTLSSVVAQDGGALVFPSFVRQMEVNMLAYGGMRQVAETIRTTSGERMVWPTVDDTSNTGEQLGENSDTSSSTADPDFGGVAWDAYKFSSKMVKVPFELLQDSAFDLPGRLGEMLGVRLGRITNTKYTTGSGANTPKGILTAASSGRSATSATAISFDDLIYLQHSIDPAYRVGASWMMHDSITLALRLLKDGENRYIWRAGATDGRPDSLFGEPITINQDMDSTIASTKKTVLYGQLSKYKIRSVAGVRLKRLDERYAENDQVAFVALIREDGNLLDAGTDPVKYLLH